MLLLNNLKFKYLKISYTLETLSNEEVLQLIYIFQIAYKSENASLYFL